MCLRPISFAKSILEEFIIVLKAKPYLVNVLLVLTLLLYSILGGVIFSELENKANLENTKQLEEEIINCTTKTLLDLMFLPQYQHIDDMNVYYSDLKAKSIFEECVKPALPKRYWHLIAATIFSFASICTIGFGTHVVMTHGGKIFYVFFCLFGIPFGLLLLSNLGQYVEEGIGILVRKTDRWLRRKKREEREMEKLEKGETIEENEDEEEFEMSGLIILPILIIYIAIGVAVRMVFANTHVVDGIYANFLSFTAVDLSGNMSTKLILIPVCIIYVFIGLALATIALSILGKLKRQLHFWGSQIKNCGQSKVWFGGKKLKVKDLVDGLSANQCQKCRGRLTSRNLDKIVTDLIDKKDRHRETKDKMEKSQNELNTKLERSISPESEFDSEVESLFEAEWEPSEDFSNSLYKILYGGKWLSVKEFIYELIMKHCKFCKKRLKSMIDFDQIIEDLISQKGHFPELELGPEHLQPGEVSATTVDKAPDKTGPQNFKEVMIPVRVYRIIPP